MDLAQSGKNSTVPGGDLNQAAATAPVSTLLVPQGAEYRAVCDGLRRVAIAPAVVPIPAGLQPVAQFLADPVPANGHPATARATALPTGSQAAVLLLGLCGSLTPDLAVGDIVLYQSCMHAIANSPQTDTPPWMTCDPALTDWIFQRLQGGAKLVRGISCDRVLCTAREKQQLGQQFRAAVVDMEGSAVLQHFNQLDIPTAILRIVSDDCHQDLPDLSAAFSSSGQLQPFPLARAMARQPQAALRLIRGSLQALAQLKAVTATLFC